MNTASAGAIDWKFWIGEVAIPIILFVLGIFVGKATERRKIKNKATIKGNSNTVIQNQTMESKK